MVESEILYEYIIAIKTEMEDVKKDLAESKKAAKDTANALSFTGVAARQAMLKIAGASTIANSLMAQFQAMIGIVADTILVALMPAIQPVIDLFWEMTIAFTELDDKHKLVVAAIFAVVAALWLVTAHPIVATITIIITLLYLAETRFGALSKAATFLSENWNLLMTVFLPGIAILVALEQRFGIFSTIIEKTIPITMLLGGVWIKSLIIQFRVLVAIVNVVVDVFKALDHILFGGSVIPHLQQLYTILTTLLIPSMGTLKISADAVNTVLGSMNALVGSITTGFVSAGTAITQSFTNVFNITSTGIRETREQVEALSSPIRKLSSLGGIL